MPNTKPKPHLDVYGNFKGIQCDLCKDHTFVTYSIDTTYSICNNCYNEIPKHIPFEQIVRYALRLIRGKDGIRKLS